MNALITIAFSTFQKLIREKIVYTIFFISFLFIALTLLLGEMTFDEQIRVMVHIGSSAIHFCLVTIAIFFGSNIVRSEINDQTILILLSRPISRAQYFLGKFIGVFLIIALVFYSLCLILYFLIITISEFNFVSYITAISGSLIEIFFLLSVSFLLSLFVRPLISIFSTYGVYLFGNWLEELKYFSKVSKNNLFINFADLAYNFSPQLFRTNWRSLHVIQNNIHINLMPSVLMHLMAWTILILFISTYFFKRKDLV